MTRTVKHSLTVAALGVAALVAFPGLSGCGTKGGLFDRLLGGDGSGPGGGSSGGGGDTLPMWSSLADSLARLDWWLGLAAGVCILVGVYRALRGDPAGGGAAVLYGVALVALNAIVAVVLPAMFYIAVGLTVCIGLVVAYRVAKGKGLGGHTLRCLFARVTGGSRAHDAAHTEGAE